jgi:hypothetical protein
VAFTIKIPPAAKASSQRRFDARRPRDGVYLSSDTGSISVRVVAVDGTSLQAPPQASSVNVPSSCKPKGCSVSLTGVPAATGTDTFVVTTFTGHNLQGSVISSGVVNVVVTAGGTIDATIGGSGQLALGGYVASILLSIAKPIAYGTASQTAVVVIPRDAGGATIVGNAVFANPITIALASPAPGLTLAGPGLQLNGSLSLGGPETASAPVMLAYDGVLVPPPAGGSTLTASSINSAGAVVTAPPLVVETPAPTPPPNVVTPLPKAPSPIASGGSSKNSVYVLNAVDNTVTEFTEPATGQVIGTNPRRNFAGTSAGCPSVLASATSGVNGIAVDGQANVWVGTVGVAGGAACASPIMQTAFEFDPSSTLNTAPRVTLPVLDLLMLPATGDVGLGIDVAKRGALDVATNSTGDSLGKFQPPAGTANPDMGFDPSNPGAVRPCFSSAGFAGPLDPSCAGAGSAGEYFGLPTIPTEFPFAIGPDGSLYFAAVDYYNGPPTNPTYCQGKSPIGCNQYALIRVPPGGQTTGVPNVADPAFIEGPNTEITQIVAMTVDVKDGRLWVLCLNSTEISIIVPIANQAQFGTQEYLLAFDLNEFNGKPGQHDVAPVGGYATARLPGAPTAAIINYENALASGDGRVYMASPIGPTPCVDPNCPPAGQTGFNNGPEGEVDVYDGSVNGIKTGVPGGMPETVLYGGAVKVPVGVTFGPRGAVLSVTAAKPRR